MRLLRAQGYTRVRSYLGGIEEWGARGGEFDSGDGERVPVSVPAANRTHRASRPLRGVVIWLDRIAKRSVGELLLTWIAIVVVFGVLYWFAAMTTGSGLLSGGVPIGSGWDGLLSALYFSCVTATSVGFGDIVPVGALRLAAVIEAALGLLVFGFVIAKFVSRHQEEVVGEIHRIAFEDRLGRVQTNLHLVLSELQGATGSCRVASGEASERTHARVLSVVLVFAGELRTVHDLLYRPQAIPDESVLESILAGLAAALDELRQLLAVAPPGSTLSSAFERATASIRTLATEICADCVPREYAAGLRESLDRVREIARTL